MANEKIIQLSTTDRDLYALTSQGRIFYDNRDGMWLEVDLPELNKTKPRSQAKESVYTDDFELFWIKWSAKGKGSKQDAFKQFRARFNERSGDVEHSELYGEIDSGARAYFKFCEETGQFAMQVCRFLGTGRHYLNDYTIPDNVKKQNRLKLPYGDNELEAFAEKHKLRMARPGESSGAYRKYLQAEINKLSE
jgi:hypothetical protein